MNDDVERFMPAGWLKSRVPETTNGSYQQDELALALTVVQNAYASPAVDRVWDAVNYDGLIAPRLTQAQRAVAFRLWRWRARAMWRRERLRDAWAVARGTDEICRCYR